jgi:hypothetical protein
MVAKGYTQMYDINYDDKVLPIIKFNLILIILAIVCSQNLDITYLCIDIALLCANLTNYFLHEAIGRSNSN